MSTHTWSVKGDDIPGPRGYEDSPFPGGSLLVVASEPWLRSIAPGMVHETMIPGCRTNLGARVLLAVIVTVAITACSANVCDDVAQIEVPGSEDSDRWPALALVTRWSL